MKYLTDVYCINNKNKTQNAPTNNINPQYSSLNNHNAVSREVSNMNGISNMNNISNMNGMNMMSNVNPRSTFSRVDVTKIKEQLNNNYSDNFMYTQLPGKKMKENKST